MNKVYDIVNDRIFSLLEKGEVPWKKPWKSAGFPKNLITQKEYRGINVWILFSGYYASPYWLSYRQAEERGGYVKKKEKGYPVVFWKLWDVGTKTETNTEETEGMENNDKKKAPNAIPVLRYYTVYNVEQCEGIEYPKPEEKKHLTFKDAEKIVDTMPNKPDIVFKENRAFYDRTMDIVNMPKKTQFETVAGYYETFFHELSHSTGHETRLNRSTLTTLTNLKDYSKEELIAELGSAYLCAKVDLFPQTEENQASYIQGWLKALQDDRTMLVHAASQGQKAADYILGKHKQELTDSNVLGKMGLS